LSVSELLVLRALLGFLLDRHPRDRSDLVEYGPESSRPLDLWLLRRVGVHRSVPAAGRLIAYAYVVSIAAIWLGPELKGCRD
jgi:hypothetical protein